jgi:hypothetical protein
MSRPKMTTIYFACFHSEIARNLRGSTGQYLAVETAILDREWPYDNGDDPSFYVARRGGPLTWGVCRQDLRNAIRKDCLVVFFSFTRDLVVDGRTMYRLCAVATVADKVEHRAIHHDPRINQFRYMYTNGLIVPKNGGWCHDESDRPKMHQHKDWLWRIADHRGMTKGEFARKYAAIYEDGWFSNNSVSLASNYILFRSDPRHTLILQNPPNVAFAINGQREEWTNSDLHAMTLGTAARWGGRDRLRIPNRSRPHRQIRFQMPADDATVWRDALMGALLGLP